MKQGAPAASMYGRYLSDERVAFLCSEEQFVRQMVRFEIALAAVQGRLGIISHEAAAAIAERLAAFSPAPGLLAEGTRRHGIPTLPLLALARQQLPEAAADALHRGATSQDVMDTACVLVINAVIDVLDERIRALLGRLAARVREHGDVVTVARTRTQHAVPIPFGLKIVAWIQPLLRHLERLGQMKPRLLVCQFGGAGGSLAALGASGGAVAEALAQELGLRPSTPWHSQRDGFAEWAGWLALLTGTLGKMGQDVLLMAQTEVAEIREGDAGHSSTMPHKNNPVLSEALVALARFNAPLAANQFQSMLHAGERDGSAWITEWMGLSQMMIASGAALNHALDLSRHLSVQTNAMAENVERSRGLILSEAALFILARHLPRSRANALVGQACALVETEGMPLAQALQTLTPDLPILWETELRPEAYLGASSHIIDQTLNAVTEIVAADG